MNKPLFWRRRRRLCGVVNSFYCVRNVDSFRRAVKRALSTIRDSKLRDADATAYLGLLGPHWITTWNILVYGKNIRFARTTAIALTKGLTDMLGGRLKLSDWFEAHHRQDKRWVNPPGLRHAPSFLEIDLCLNGGYEIPHATLAKPVKVGTSDKVKQRAVEMHIAAAKRFKPDNETEKLVRDRGEDYGKPSDNHGRTAKLWSAYLSGMGVSVKLRPADVCFLNILQKISRSQHKLTDDTIADIAGYAANIAEMEEEAL